LPGLRKTGGKLWEIGGKPNQIGLPPAIIEQNFGPNWKLSFVCGFGLAIN